MASLLDSLILPGDLQRLSMTELQLVANELRDELIDSVSSSGGHLASSLGVVELTVALHHIFDAPRDRIIWDVGHQAYIHKMVTGRRKLMATIRKRGGISGFPRRDESPYDAFGVGHAGTSISAAVGMRAALATTDPESFVVGIIGDASITCGMAFEALNHAGDLGLRNLIIILNDNEMSIAPNVGALKWFFSRTVTSQGPTRARSKIKKLYERGLIPEMLFKAVDRAEEAAQGFISSPAMLFEAFGFRYIGPVNGHSIPDVVQALRNARQQDVPVLIHAHTIKGKGYNPAESDPVKWHGVIPFSRSRGEFERSPAATTKRTPSYTDVFSHTILKLARQDQSVVGITAAMPTGTGLDLLQQELPKQFYDVGICEQHAVTFAAGLACEHLRPVCAIYSSFLQRAFDQVVHDVCLQNLPVVFAIDRGGVVGADGETHQGVFDIAFLRALPNIILMSPKDENELQHMLYTALQHNGPVAIRYPRGQGVGVALDSSLKTLPIGRGEILLRGEDVLLVCFGPLVQHGLATARLLADRYGLSTTILNARFVKPLDLNLMQRELPRHQLVCTLEDHALMGGFGSALLELIEDHQIQLQRTIKRFGIGDSFVPHATQAEQHCEHSCDVENLALWIGDQFSSQKLAALG